MRRVNIRDLNGAFFEEAVHNQEPVGITNSNQLSAVFLPISEAWVDQVIVDNLSRLRNNIAQGIKETSSSISFDEAVAEKSGGEDLPFTRRVQIRELSGRLLAEAAERGEHLGVMNNGRLTGILIPVSPRWVDQLIDHSISRIAYSVEQADKASAALQDLTSFDELIGTPRHRLAET